MAYRLWTNDGLVYGRIYASFGFNGLAFKVPRYIIEIPLVTEYDRYQAIQTEWIYPAQIGWIYVFVFSIALAAICRNNDDDVRAAYGWIRVI